MIGLALGFFRSSLYARLAIVAAVTFGAWQIDRLIYGAQRESNGVKKAEETIRKANDQAVSKSGRARRKSSTPSVRGVRDPNSADN